MLILFELVLILLIIAYIMQHQIVRSWQANLRSSDYLVAVLLVALVLGAHFLDRGGRFFPLVSWRMYTHKYEPEAIEWAEVHVEFVEGTKKRINPAVVFPSIARNFQDRLLNYSVASQKGKLNERQKSTFEQLLISYGAKAKDLAGLELKSVEAVLCRVNPDAPDQVNRQVIKRLDIAKHNRPKRINLVAKLEVLRD